MRRLLALVLPVLLLASLAAPAQATPPDAYYCLHPDLAVSAEGQLLSSGDQLALDGGMAHAGTGLTLDFQAHTVNTPIDLCNLRMTDARVWQVDHWPCTNAPKPQPARSQSLSWSVHVPLDCKFIGSPNLLSVSLTNGKGSAAANVMIYAGAPGFVLPDKQARAFFGPFAMQSDPVNSLTGALAAVETDASVTAVGLPLTVTRTYNSNDTVAGALGVGWRSSYSDRLVLSATGARYLASDGREIGFTRKGPAFAVEAGPGRFTLARSGSTYLLTSIDQTRMQFSTSGELEAIRDRNGQGVTISHAAGRVQTVANGRRSLSYDYDSQGQLTSVRLSGPGVAPRTVRYEYADGHLAAAVSPGGIRTQYEYVDRRLTSERVGDATAFVTEYDTDGRVVAQTDGDGGRSTWSWDTDGIRGTSTMTDPTGGKWLNEYERNWLIRQTDPTGATATFHYDAEGNLIRVFDNLGHGARHEYDALGRVVASTDAAGAVTRRTYNPRNDVVVTVDPLGRRTTYSYDARGNPTGTSYGGRTSSVTYDRRGLVTASRDPLGRTTQYAYSVDGDLVRVVDPARQMTRVEYDGWGRPVKVTSPRGAVSTVSYNDDDQPLEQHGALGVSTRQTYDAQGRVSTLVDARGGTTKLRYDGSGAVVGVTRPSLPEATTAYDASGRVTKTVDAGGRAQTFTYDGAGRTTEATYGDRTWRFTYDKAGRLIRTTLPSGRSASFTLDARGAPLRIAYSDKTPAVSFTWDAAGRRTSMTDGTGVTRFGYDSFDHLSSSTGPSGVVRYQWDAVGNLAGRTAAGHTESYTWDPVDRLVSATADGKALASYRYDLAGGTITTTQPGGLVKTEQVDLRGRTTSLSVTQNARPVRTITSAYDAADNLTHSNDSVAGEASYEYDPLNRLTAANSIRYAYDGSGNRTWEQRPSGSTWSLYGASNELRAAITTPADYPLAPPSARSYTYDKDGNLTSDGTTTYTWSAAGKPVTSTTAGATTTYTHSGDGRRATSSTGRQTTRYLWDPLSPQILNTSTDAKPTRYLYGSSLLAEQAGATRTPLTTAPNGSLLTTATTKPTQHDYEPYGQTRAGPADPPTTSGTPSAQPTPGYIGGLKLPTGNYLLGQREYNPTTGTFLTTDQAGSANPYAYTTGNPLKTTDLQGLDDVEGTLTDVSHISGYISTAALAGAVICAIARACAPAIPIFLEISSATGVISAGTAGILDSEACVLKGNCSQLAAQIAVGLVATRIPAAALVERAGPEMVTVYRIEGAGNRRLLIGDTGDVSIQGQGMLFLNFGDKERALSYYQRRHSQGYGDSQMKAFEVPRSYVDSLRRAAVSERAAKANPRAPLSVDRSKAGDQFGLRSCHFPELLEQVQPGSGRIIC
ncbi:DUF6531 domain-containing protein [Kribbella sp. NPDC059898]|uniref:DUF6531 domain-containing protein n=1 Tax=Kribbella sp. NPDC059898 TaxID=3346995 RepID=UPI0036644E7F